MKLAMLAVLVGLVAPSVARADVLNPPGGPVYVDDADSGPPPPRDRPARQRRRDPQRLRQALITQFDTNGDGRLGPRERVRAIRALREIERRLAEPMRQRGRQLRQRGARAQGRQRPQRDRMIRRFMRRYDVNRDGQVGPQEVPRGAADRLRRFDRNGDGWVDRDELP